MRFSKRRPMLLHCKSLEPPMSQMGHEQPSWHDRPTSASANCGRSSPGSSRDVVRFTECEIYKQKDRSKAVSVSFN